MHEILKLIKPSKEEEQRAKEKVNSFVSQLTEGTSIQFIVGGSFGKGTWLRGNHDVDIFALFENDKNCSNILEEIIKRRFRKYERIHGSRDYFQIYYKGLNYEIVPVFKIKKPEEARNVTDVSPLHVSWVNQHTDQKLKDEIRLAKQFFKAQRVYGAETFMRGFSGYVVEILTIHYDGFEELIRGITKWKVGGCINPSRRKFDLNPDKISPLILIDPVQPNRNTAAALGIRNFERIISAAREYAALPTPEYFKIKKTNLDELKNKDIVVVAKALKGKKDIVGTKLLKVYEKILFSLKKEGFGVEESDWDWNDRVYFWFNVNKKSLEPTQERVGPPIKNKINVEGFKRTHKDKEVYEREGRMYVKLKRKHTELRDFVKEMLKNKEIKEKVKSIKLLN